jgi:Neuraminidase (sialidase)
MPVASAVHTLSDTTATQIVNPDNMIQRVTLHNMSKSSNQYIFIGTETVTTTNAIHIDPGETMQLQLRPNDDLWAVSNPDGLDVGVLVVTKRD